MPKKHGKRQVERIRAAYKVKHEQSDRMPLSVEDIELMCNDMEKNNLSKFGIIKLSRFDLNAVFNLTSGKRTTLTHYAWTCGRDRIISALIRAGCDPSLYPGLKESQTIDIVGKLLDFSMAYRVWLVEFMYGLIEQSVREREEKERVATDGINHVDDKMCPCCQKKSGSHVCNEEILLQWTPCGHRVCVDCSWLGASRKLHTTQYALRCPVCNCRCDGSEEDFYTSPYCTIAEADAVELFPIRHVDMVAVSPPDRKALSLEVWRSLPPDIDSSNKSIKHPKISIAPCPMHILSQYLTGSVQSQRTMEFFKAAVSNNVYRLYWLLRRGVHVDARDEYGQTALLAACCYGQCDSVKFLLWAGSDCTLRDNCNCGAGNIAHAHDHVGILDVLAKHGLDSVCPIPSALGPSVEPVLGDISVTTLIAAAENDHLGAGSCYIDNCFSESFLRQLEQTWQCCPETPPTKQSCSSRYYICDSTGWIRSGIANAIESARRMYFQRYTLPDLSNHALQCTGTFANMRFLQYSQPGGSLPPHEDLSRTDTILGHVSTHTFILYLTSVAEGGETTLLRSAVRSAGFCEDYVQVTPVRGRLLLFPHKCPHEGAPIIDVPKLLLRGEAF